MIPKVTKSYQKLPKDIKSWQQLSKVGKSYQQLAKATKSYQKIIKCYQKLPIFHKICLWYCLLQIVLIEIQTITKTSSKETKMFQLLPNVTKSYQKLPKVIQTNQKLPKIIPINGKSYQKLAIVTKSYQQILPKVSNFPVKFVFDTVCLQTVMINSINY